MRLLGWVDRNPKHPVTTEKPSWTWSGCDRTRQTCLWKVQVMKPASFLSAAGVDEDGRKMPGAWQT